MDLKVEIRENIGVRIDDELGKVEMVNDHKSIIVSTEAMKKAGRAEIEVGLVSLVPGRPINLLPPINRFPPEVRKAIVEEVKSQLLEIAQEAAETQGLDAETQAVVAANLEKEESLDRKAFFPPSDAIMTAPPPQDTGIVDASGKPIPKADVEGFI